MRRLSILSLMVVAVSLCGAKLLITQDQATVGGALQTLKFEQVPAKGGVIGGDQEYKVTKDTLDFLKGKSFVVDGSGKISVKK